MTDKQIIIDGVDVSGCEDYKCDGTCASSAYHLFNYDTKYATCKNRTCHYKNWQRAEQKLSKIKKITKPYNDMSGNTVIVNCFKDMNVILQIIEGKENDLY